MIENKLKGVMLGHAIGDALGVPVEFSTREQLEDNPVYDMEGFGTYNVPKGFWSDDTCMALATLDSLKRGKVDPEEIMRNFSAWYNHGKYTPDGLVFDIGNTCMRAICNFDSGKKVDDCGLSDVYSNGNGSLMRIHPLAVYLYTRDDLTIAQKSKIIFEVSGLTHAHTYSKVACGIYCFVLWEIISGNGCPREMVYYGLKKAYDYYGSPDHKFDRLYSAIGSIDGSLQEALTAKALDVDDINSGGYVIDTIEAAIYCFVNTSSYENCVLAAVNMGGDTDTTGAVAGGLAGAYYGVENIPDKWLSALKRKEYVEEMCECAAASWNKRS